MSSWGNDVTVVRPTDPNGDQALACIGRVYVNGTEVRTDAIEIDIDPEEITTVIIALPIANLRIVSDADLVDQVEKLIDLGGQRKIIVGRPIVGTPEGKFDANAYDGDVRIYHRREPGGNDEVGS